MKDFKKTLTRGSLILLVLVILGYTYYRTIDLRRGVTLEVTGIQNNNTYHEPLLKLKGRAVHATSLSINNRNIPVDKDWSFKESLLLLPGWNIIEVKAEDKFGRKNVKNYQVILD